MCFLLLQVFSEGDDNLLMYKTPPNIEYKVNFLFSKLVSAESNTGTPCSIYDMMSKIQEECKVCYMIFISTSEVSMFGLPKVSCIKERFILEVLVLMSLNRTFP